MYAFTKLLLINSWEYALGARYHHFVESNENIDSPQSSRVHNHSVAVVVA